MNKTGCFFDHATGLFNGARVSLPPHAVEQNTPDGHTFLEGVYDPLSQRVDLATGDVVDYQPPSPGDDAMQTWRWDRATKRWRASPTRAALAAQAQAQVDEQIRAVEVSQLRPMRELVLDPTDATARAKLKAADDRIAELRTERAQADAPP